MLLAGSGVRIVGLPMRWTAVAVASLLGPPPTDSQLDLRTIKALLLRHRPMSWDYVRFPWVRCPVGAVLDVKIGIAIARDLFRSSERKSCWSKSFEAKKGGLAYPSVITIEPRL
jgi:hypothetical protein